MAITEMEMLAVLLQSVPYQPLVVLAEGVEKKERQELMLGMELVVLEV